MALQTTEAYFTSSTGKNQIRTLLWQDTDLTPIGVFQIAHGMAEHIERYADFAEFLAGNGFIVCGNDHLGHGKSVSALSELGYIAETDGDKRLVDDMHILTQIMKKRCPDLPYFLFGHSMGSLCARVYTTHFGEELSGVVYCGTTEVPAGAEAFLPLLKSLCARVGAKTPSALLPKLMNGTCSLFVKEDGKAPKEAMAWLSKNEANRAAYQNDPYCGFPFTLGGYRDLFALAVECGARDWAQKVPKNLPILLISGAKDPVGFNGKGPLCVSDNLALAGIDPTVILYPEDRHEILLEADRETVYNDILTWLQSTYVCSEL